MPKKLTGINKKALLEKTLPALEPSMRNLRTWNMSMAGLHAVQAGLMFWLSTDFRLPVTTAFVQFNTASQRLEPVLKTFAEAKIGPLVAGFLLLSALAHLMVSLPGMYEWYTKHIAKGINPARWIEYSFSSSLMIVVIAMLVGIYDMGTLIALFGLNAMMILFGWLMELHNQTTKKVDWTSFIFGSIAGIIPWMVIAIYLFGAGGSNGQVPTFVYWIYLSIFVFFNCFAINMVLQYKKVGKWQDYLYGEKAYIILSLVAKSLLAWQVWAGTLRPV